MTDEQQRTDTSIQDPARKVRRPMATRNGSAKWTGDLKTGSGELTVGEGAWTSAYSGRSRFAGVLPWFEVSEGTNPEELLAAAHAACFSMALSLGLSDAGHPPSSIQTTARVHLRVVGGAPAIQQIDLSTEADVPGLDQEEFQEPRGAGEDELHHLPRARRRG